MMINDDPLQDGIRVFRPIRVRESDQARAEAKAARARLDSGVTRPEANQVNIAI